MSSEFHPHDDSPILAVSSMSGSKLVGLLVGLTLGTMALLGALWVCLRYRKSISANIAAWKKRVYLLIGIAVAGIWLFGPPIFQRYRTEEPEPEADNVNSTSTTVLIGRHD